MNHKHRPRALAAALCLAAAAAHAAPAAPAAGQARQAVAAAHAQIDTALERKEYFAVTAACTPDFVSINDQGQHFTAADVRSGLERQLGRARTIQSTTQITALTLAPAGAVVSVSQHLTVFTPYKALFFGRVARTTLDQTRREVWVKLGPAWRLKQSQTLSNITRTRY